jgi:hypothetical protein
MDFHPTRDGSIDKLGVERRHRLTIYLEPCVLVVLTRCPTRCNCRSLRCTLRCSRGYRNSLSCFFLSASFLGSFTFISLNLRFHSSFRFRVIDFLLFSLCRILFSLLDLQLLLDIKLILEKAHPIIHGRNQLTV